MKPSENSQLFWASSSWKVGENAPKTQAFRSVFCLATGTESLGSGQLPLCRCAIRVPVLHLCQCTPTVGRLWLWEKTTAATRPYVAGEDCCLTTCSKVQLRLSSELRSFSLFIYVGHPLGVVVAPTCMCLRSIADFRWWHSAYFTWTRMQLQLLPK